jgi:NADPH-ferrihemoprotein reductase
MLKLGAYPVVDVGTGDDDVDIDADFDSWCSDLFESLDAKPILEAGEASALTASAVPAYHIEMIADAPVEAVNGRLNGSGTSQASPHLATISVVKELHTSSSDRSCVHVEIDISRCSATYESGDHVGIFAENSPEVVSSAAKVLRYPVETCFKMSIPPNNADGLTEPPSGPVTLGFVLARYADLLSSPSKASLAALAAFATDPEEAARLSALASIEGRDAYYSYVSSSKRSLLEIMEEFRSLRIPLGAFFATVAPRLQPRFYSISSSPALHPRSVHVTAAVVKDKMPTGRIHEGVATTWLARSTPGKTVVPIFLRRSAFKLPRNLSTPVVMVGPGTGLAPFRGFIQERAAARSRGEAIGPAVLYFGCRRRDHDYIYKEELEFAVASGALTALNVAFSREGDVKDYVQHHMARQGAEIWDLLGPKGKGYLYVCGDAKNMAKDVHNTLLDIAGKVNGGKAHAEASIRELLDSGRYLKDVW